MAYASKYYDPVKAHEYYVNYTKKGLLKGRKGENSEEAERKSTKSLNDEGKAVAKQVRQAIAEERKEVYKMITERVREVVKNLRAQMKEEGFDKEEIADRVAQLRDTAKEWRSKVKEVYKEKYLSELDKIKQDPSFQKPQKKSRKRKK